MCPIPIITALSISLQTEIAWKKSEFQSNTITGSFYENGYFLTRKVFQEERKNAVSCIDMKLHHMSQKQQLNINTKQGW